MSSECNAWNCFIVSFDLKPLRHNDFAPRLDFQLNRLKFFTGKLVKFQKTGCNYS